MPNPIRVFVSYSWDSEFHKQQVLALVQRLRGDGIDAWLDRFTPFPAEGWARWTAQEIKNANLVIVVLTEKYAQRFSGLAQPGEGLGATWEGAIITNELYKTAARNERFIPIVLSPADRKHIPDELSQYTFYPVETEEEYRALYRQLTSQPEVAPGPLGPMLDLPSSPVPVRPSPLDIPVVHDHAAAASNLPRLPYGFFGREDELSRIARSLSPDTRSWGALIDGPGGIGKTALAVRAAELTPPGQFERVIFLSSKSRELTVDGAKPLANFMLPGYLDMLNELARHIDRAEITKTTADNRPSELLRALRNRRLLLILDNLESVSVNDRDRLFDFLGHLPATCKAIVTSRRRDDVDARVVRLDKLGREAAMQLMAKLAEDRELLARANTRQLASLYETTGGNPLLIRWTAGQLGRGRCKTVEDAIAILRKATKDNDPLEFIFGDLAESFTENETKVLAALSHFTAPMDVKFIAELSSLPRPVAQAALEDLTSRALVGSDPESTRFVLTPLVADFLRRARPEAVVEIGGRLSDHVYALVLENAVLDVERLRALETAWPMIAAGLPPMLEADYQRFQETWPTLRFFLNFSGRWDESIVLNTHAEGKAVALGDFFFAGWYAYETGYFYTLRGSASEALAFAERAEQNWRQANAGAIEQAAALRLRSRALGLANDYPGAAAASRQAVQLLRTNAPGTPDLAAVLSDYAGILRQTSHYEAAEKAYAEALRIVENGDDKHMIANLTSELATLALDREDWVIAEVLARAVLDLEDAGLGKELIGTSATQLACALARQGRAQEALPLARRGHALLTQLRSPKLEWADDVLRTCDLRFDDVDVEPVGIPTIREPS
jgi:tetratricopeptide (TPR) repeat protein